MVTLDNRVRKNYRCYIVAPVGDFKPTNWQQRPSRFKILSRINTTPRLGKADSWKFVHNTAAMKNSSAGTWAVVLN